MHFKEAYNSIRAVPGRLRLLAALLFLGGLAACAAVSGKDLRKEYVSMVKRQGLTAVYPPREEFQVGDVFIRSYSTKDATELDTRAVVWLGTLTTMRQAANDYMESRITFADTATKKDKREFDLTPGQDDFAAGVVALNNGARKSLPVVAFPTISGSAVSAGALGGFGFLSSFGLALGQSEQVSLDFTDTRAFGVPLGAAPIAGQFEGEYLSLVCKKFEDKRTLVQIGFQRLGLVAEHLEVDPQDMCGKGRNCDVAVITRTYLTRQLKFNYSSARVARLAAAARRSPPDPEKPTTVAIPGNLSIDVTLAPDDDGQQLNNLVKGLSDAVTSGGGQETESAGLSFLGFQGNTLAFQRVYRKPVAIAYDSINYNLKGGSAVCGFKAPGIEKK